LRYNLKNFPRSIEGKEYNAADQWVEGFEAELRERKMKLYDVTVLNPKLNDAKKLIKEILGE